MIWSSPQTCWWQNQTRQAAPSSSGACDLCGRSLGAPVCFLVMTLMTTMAIIVIAANSLSTELRLLLAFSHLILTVAL